MAATLSRRDLWKASIKIPMYTVAVTPIVVGSAAAFADTRAFSPSTLALFLLAAVLIIAWLNCTNDVFDFDTGIDVNKKESLVNLCGGTRSARNKVLFVATLFLVGGFACLFMLSTSPAFDPTVLALLGVSVFGGYAYQGPPFRLGYLGLGEPICFVTWFLSTIAAYYSQVQRGLDLNELSSGAEESSHRYAALGGSLRSSLGLLSDRLLKPTQYALSMAALLVALPTAIILFCSHFHQLTDDKAAGKRSPIVRLGTLRASKLLRQVLMGMYILQVVSFFAGALPLLPMLLVTATFPYAKELSSFVSTYHGKPERVRVAKYYAVRLHFVHGMALSAGYFLAGWSSSYTSPLSGR